MISAGYIGGGAGAVTNADGTVTIPAAEYNQLLNQGGGTSIGPAGLPETRFPMAQLSSEDAKAEFAANRQLYQKENAANRTMGYVQMGLGLINSYIGYKIQSEWFDTNQAINDRRVEAQENISVDNNKTAREWIKFQNESSKRLDGPGGLKDREQARQLASNERMYEKKLETQKELAAMQQLDQAFAVRSDYSYGNPYYG